MRADWGVAGRSSQTFTGFPGGYVATATGLLVIEPLGQTQVDQVEGAGRLTPSTHQ